MKLPEVEQMGNEELLYKFNDLLASLGQFARFTTSQHQTVFWTAKKANA